MISFEIDALSLGCLLANCQAEMNINVYYAALGDHGGFCDVARSPGWPPTPDRDGLSLGGASGNYLFVRG